MAKKPSAKTPGRSRPTRPKHVQLGGNIDLVVQGPQVARRDIRDIHEYQQALEMLLVSGYVVVGNFVPVGKSELFSSLSAVKSYLSFVRQKCQGHFSASDLLSLVRASDEDTRCLWAESMRSGATLSEAMATCAAKQEALWLWARAGDVLNARGVVTPDGAEKRKRPLFDDEENEDRRKRQNKGDKGKGRGKGKGDEKKKGGKGGKGGAPQKQGAQETCEKSATGEDLCRGWNNGGCGDKCSGGRTHRCNLKVNGRACYAKHRRCEFHRS